MLKNREQIIVLRGVRILKKVIIIIASAISIVVLLVFASYFFLHSAFETFFPYSVVHTGTSGEYAEKTEKLLEKKYGEKFKVVRYANNEATAYPESNPELLFMARRNYKSDVVRDTYIQEIVALQYKELAEDVLKDFKYDYYLDVDFEFSYEPIDAKQDVTIEEFKKVVPKEVMPKYYLYVSENALEMSYEELYKLINNIATIPEQENSLVRMFFLNNSQMQCIVEDYEEYSYRHPSVVNDTENILNTQQNMENGELLIDFKRFSELIEGENIKK